MSSWEELMRAHCAKEEIVAKRISPILISIHLYKNCACLCMQIGNGMHEGSHDVLLGC